MKTARFQAVPPSFDHATCLALDIFRRPKDGCRSRGRAGTAWKCRPARTTNASPVLYRQKMLRRATLIVTQQATQTLVADNFAQWLSRLRQGRLRPAQRTVVQTLMRTHPVIIGQIFGQDVSQMRLAEYNEMIETLTLHALHKAFGECILIGCPHADGRYGDTLRG